MMSLAVDSSSAILLYKAELFELLLEQYTVVMATAVIQEITQNGYDGSADFDNYCDNGRITVIKPDLRGISCRGVFEDLNKLHSGECETIILLMKGEANAIMIDDGSGARLCKKAKMPFINALLFPRILFLSGMITEDVSEEYIKRLIYYGRYSDDIITFALNCTAEQISYFMPPHSKQLLHN